MSKLKSLKAMFNVPDVSVAVALIMIVGVMIIPIPTWGLDVLMSLNLSIAIILLLVVLYLKESLEFSAFPQILLVMTLFRLAINVASTKLILSSGPDFDGQIVMAFADFVTRGNLVVGLVTFSIITLVQFVVVTKGSERVAEVSARFTLDALPGKQMSIDADLNAGLIDAEESRARRKKLEKESTFFGSMDGANKFVKGDAVAGIVIVIVNIIGGLLIGRFQQALDLGESTQVYVRLTVGDGLVSQIPALLISVATGLVVTKAASEESFGSDVKRQIFEQPKPFAITAIILLGLSVVPGFPFRYFFLLACLAGLFSLSVVKAKKTQEAHTMQAQQNVAKQAMKKPENLLGTLSLDPISLKVGRNLVPLIDPNQNGPLLERITLVRYHIGQELGFVIPGVRIMDELSLPVNAYEVYIRGTQVGYGEVVMGHYFVGKSATDLKHQGVPGIEAVDPITQESAAWVPEDKLGALQEQAISGLNTTDFIAMHFSEVIMQHADEIMTRQNVQSLLDLVKNTNAAIVRELIPDMLSLGQVHKVLQILVSERVSIRDLSTILERLADYATISRDTNLLAEYVRQALARQICSKYVDKDNSILLFTIDPEFEEKMINAIHQSEYGSFLALDPDVGQSVLAQIGEFVRNFRRLDKEPVGLCSPKIRTYFKKFLERNYPRLIIMSYTEIPSNVKVQSIGILSN